MMDLFSAPSNFSACDRNFFPAKADRIEFCPIIINAYDCFIMQAYATHSLSDFKLPYKFPQLDNIGDISFKNI